MKQIIVVKPNSITKESKLLLKEEDVIVIEHENPNEVRVINTIDGFVSDDVFNCAIDAIISTKNTDFPKTKFAELLINAILKKRIG